MSRSVVTGPDHRIVRVGSRGDHVVIVLVNRIVAVGMSCHEFVTTIFEQAVLPIATMVTGAEAFVHRGRFVSTKNEMTTSHVRGRDVLIVCVVTHCVAIVTAHAPMVMGESLPLTVSYGLEAGNKNRRLTIRTRTGQAGISQQTGVLQRRCKDPCDRTVSRSRDRYELPIVNVTI